MAFWSRHDPAPYLPIDQPVEQTPAPKYVDESQFKEALAQVQSMNTRLEQFTGMFTSLMGAPSSTSTPQQPSRTPLPDIPDITDAEYEEALFKSDAAKINIRMKAEAARAARASDERWETRITELESRGFAALDAVSGEMNQTALNTMPYYHILKSDVDAALGTLPPHQRTPAMREHVYHAVVGKNLDKIRAHDAAEATRAAAQRHEPGAPGRAQTPTGPTAATVFGDDLLQQGATWKGGSSLWSHGHKSPDQFAQTRYGVENIQQAAVYAANVLAMEDCHHCFSPVINGKCHCRKSV